MRNLESLRESVTKSIRTIPDFPKPGIQFRDISTLLKNPEAYKNSIVLLGSSTSDLDFNVIAAAESRGFLFGCPLAIQLQLPVVMVRKKGKLPGDVIRQEYQLEYGTDSIEVSKDSFNSEDRVLIVDDLMATGGTVEAICQLVEKCGAQVAGIACLVDLPDLGGSKKLSDKYPVRSVVEFQGE